MLKIQHPVVAGTFYPDNPSRLKQMLKYLLSKTSAHKKQARALIVPHAGYIYSGAIAATAYARLRAEKQNIKKIVLIGPSHHLGFQGVALNTAEQFLTPLGAIAVNGEAIKRIATLPFAHFINQAYSKEHSLEVHLPFLQSVIGTFSLIPVVTGKVSAEQLCELIELFWGDLETIIIISSDLSHFLEYEAAQHQDKKTSAFIEQLQYEKLDRRAACGYIPISGLLALARKKSLQVKTLDLRNSADTAGSAHKNRVVGYGSYAID